MRRTISRSNGLRSRPQRRRSALPDPSRRFWCAAGCLAISAMLAGCGAGTRHLPALTTERTLQREAYDDRDWALTLLENVVDGLINYRHLGEHSEPLLRYLALLEHVGPQSAPEQFPTRGHALAYYVNAYNACVMRAVLEEQAPDTVYRPGVISFERRYTFIVDGQRRTLADLRDLARKAAGLDVRVEFCLCEPAIGAPPLPSQPVRFDGLEQQLETVARGALARERALRVDHAGERLLLALWIFDRRDLFVEWYRRRTQTTQTTLLNALNALADEPTRQRLASAVGYRIAPMAFDRRLNRAAAGS